MYTIGNSNSADRCSTLKAGIIRDMGIGNKFTFIPNDDNQYYQCCILICWLKRLDTTNFELNNQNSEKYAVFLSKRIS